MSESIRPRIRVPDQAAPGEVVEILAMLTHPHDSGHRTDPATGTTIARHIVERFTCRLDGALVFEATLHPAVAANPYLAFELTAERGGRLDFEWIDDRGAVFTAEAELRVI